MAQLQATGVTGSLITTGAVGVSTTAAPGTFNVLGTSYFSDDIYLRDGAVAAGDVLVRIYDSSDDGVIDVYRNNSVVNRIHGNGPSYITAGNLGINTTIPAYTLQVNGNFNATNPMINSEGTSNDQSVMQWRYGTSDAYRLRLKQTVTSGVVRWNFSQTNNNSDFNDVLVLDRGNVGIGTTSPGWRLQVNTSNAVAAALQTTGTYASLRWTGDGGTTNGALAAFNGIVVIGPLNGGGTGVDNGIYIKTSDTNVGIGSASPAAKLDVVASNSTLAISYGNTVPNNPLHTNYYGGFTGIGMDSATAGVRIVGDTNTLVMDTGYYAGGTIQHAAWTSLLKVMTNGNVGIGTTSPADKLHVVGGGRFEGSLDLGYGAASEYSLEIGQGRTGNGFAYIDLVGDTTYPDYGLRILRNNGGANTTSDIIHRGTGDFSIGTNEAAPLIFNTNNAERMRILSGGNVGIGITNPTYKFEISDGTRTGVFNPNSVLDGFFIGTKEAKPLILGSSDTERMRIISDGNVGIGITNPGAKLHVVGDTYIQGTEYIFQSVNNTIGYLYFDHSGTQVWKQGVFNDNTSTFSIGNGGGFTRLLNITNGGNVGIGTATITASRLRVEGATSEANSIADFISNDTSAAATYHRGIRVLAPSLPANDKLLVSVGVADNTRNMGQFYFNYISAGSTNNFLSLGLFAVDEVLNVAGTSNVGIGVTNPGAKLHIDSGDTGATAYALRTDAASLDYALYVSASGNVAVGGLVPANQLNHKFVVFSGSIALRGPNDPNFSYRLNDTGGTNRNALYVSSSNYLNVGNIAYAGIELFHTSSFENTYIPTGEYLVNRIYSNIEGNDVLGTPDKWLAVRVGGKNYAIPMYDLAP
jgi:hypothetical protein